MQGTSRLHVENRAVVMVTIPRREFQGWGGGSCAYTKHNDKNKHFYKKENFTTSDVDEGAYGTKQHCFCTALKTFSV